MNASDGQIVEAHKFSDRAQCHIILLGIGMGESALEVLEMMVMVMVMVMVMA